MVFSSSDLVEATSVFTFPTSVLTSPTFVFAVVATSFTCVIWASRMKAAHFNSIENLVVFATLVLIANAAAISNAATVFAASLYFWARLVHLVAYTLKLPWIRTLGFTGGFVAQAIFAWQIVIH